MAAVLTPAPALAATKTWVGGDGNWSSGANWSGGTHPNPGDDLIFPVGTGHMTTNDFPDGTFFNSILIDAGGYTLNGSPITIASGQSISANYGSGATSTINLAV